MSYPKNLKYPFTEYQNLIIVIKQLAPYFEIGLMQPNQLHYLAVQQTNKIRQSHNRLFITSQGLQRSSSLNEITTKEVKKTYAKPIVNVDFELDLYPNECNDTHIETATKRAVKEVLTDGSIKHKTT